MRAKDAEGATGGQASLSATQAEALDRACDRFEAEWRAGKRPTIEDHLEGIAAPLGSALLVARVSPADAVSVSAPPPVRPPTVNVCPPSCKTIRHINDDRSGLRRSSVVRRPDVQPGG
jgi:hypothetical protein